MLNNEKNRSDKKDNYSTNNKSRTMTFNIINRSRTNPNNKEKQNYNTASHAASCVLFILMLFTTSPTTAWLCSTVYKREYTRNNNCYAKKRTQTSMSYILITLRIY